MIIINNIDGAYFEFNGIRYFKNFTSVVAGNKLRILNVYDSKIELLALTDFSQVTLDGVIHTNVADLQTALLPVIYAIDMVVTYNEVNNDSNELIEKGFNHKENFDWFVFAQVYRFNGVITNNLITDIITLDPSPTTTDFKRFDVIVFNDDFTFSVVKGDEGLSPAIPKIDILTQIQLTVILVEANTTEPSYLTKSLIYNEGLGLPTEWTVTELGTNITINSLEQASNGTKSIKVANPTNSDRLFLDKGATFNSLDVDTISFKVKNLTAGNWRFFIYSYNSIGGFYQGTAIVKNDTYGYDSNNITDWQTIIVPISSILGTGEVYNTGFALTFFTNSGATFFFDEFQLNGGFTEPIQTANTTTFLQLTDTPTTYAGQAGKSVIVNATETGVEFGGGGATNTDQLPEGTSNLYFTTARVLATILSGFSIITGGDVVATDTVLEAFGKLQKQISDLISSTTINASGFVKNLAVTDNTAQKVADKVDALVLGGSNLMEYPSEITTANYDLLATDDGAFKLLTFNKETAQTVTVNNSIFTGGDIINLWRKGVGTTEIIKGTGVSIRGIRDVDNRFFINNSESAVCLLCETPSIFRALGNLKRGGSIVTVTSYSALVNTGIAQVITVTGTNFSANMNMSITGNATLNSWAYVSSTSITLNITETGVVSDFITVIYDNGEIFIDTNAIQIIDNIKIADYSFDGNLIDSVSGRNGVGTNISYETGVSGQRVVFNAVNDSVVIADDNVFSFGNGTTDIPFSISFKVRLSSWNSFGSVFINKRGTASSTEWEYTLWYDYTGFAIVLVDESTGGTLYGRYNITPVAGTVYKLVFTYSGNSLISGIKIYENKISKTVTNVSSGTYVAMENKTSPITIGKRSWDSTNGQLVGSIEDLVFYNKELSQVEIDAII